MSRVNGRRPLLLGYLCKAQSVISALTNITLSLRDDDGTNNDDIEVLGDLLVEELPQDLRNLMLRLEEGAGRKQ
ncbi:hypothetical protein Hamer_G024980 [Homarus americanus]|uniref:Uncharacterized protein n=1 Tax=Homarus americanus TaxID=6706 RepID=A0A8J5MZZ0_HOMAM|nr:hypothetical protein Hamer_G024980 [Homarus americanus]